MEWIEACRFNKDSDGNADPHVARIIFNAKENKYEWVGDLDWPCFVGHPNLSSVKVKNDDGDIVIHQFVKEVGIPIHGLFPHAETHCIVVVRADVYNKR